MPSRNIAVQKATYDALLHEKRGSESFTSVIRRLLEHQADLTGLAGVWGRSLERSDEGALRALRSGGRSRR
jgi:predicted CopG family antitoxin